MPRKDGGGVSGGGANLSAATQQQTTANQAHIMVPPIHTGALADEDVSLHQQLKAVIRAEMLTAEMLTADMIHLQSFEWTMDESAVLAWTTRERAARARVARARAQDRAAWSRAVRVWAQARAMRARSILKMPEHLYTASPHGYQQRPLQRSLHSSPRLLCTARAPLRARPRPPIAHRDT